MDSAAVTPFESSQVARLLTVSVDYPAAVNIHLARSAILAALGCVRMMAAVGAESSAAQWCAGARLRFGPSGRFDDSLSCAGCQNLVSGHGN